MIEVRIAKVIQPDTFRTLVMLHDREENAQQRVLSIWLKANGAEPVGNMRMNPEGQSALLEPLTRDFIVNLLKVTNSTVNRVEVEELQDEILYANIYIDTHGVQQHLKARLNDAIPLAMYLDSGIYVSDAVMEKLGQKLPEPTNVTDQIDTLSNAITNKMYTGFMGQTVVMRKEPRNLDFSDGLHGWRFIGFPKETSIYRIDHTVKRREKGSLFISNQDAQPLSTASLSHEGFLADNYLGKRLGVHVSMKTDDVKQVMLTVEVNGPKDARRLRQVSAPVIRGTNDWAEYSIIFDVPHAAALLKFTVHMLGKGRIWLDQMNFDVVDASVPLTEDAGPRIPFPEEPQNTHFAYNLAHWDLWGSYPQDYSCGIDTKIGVDSATCGYIKSNASEPRGYGILRQTLRSQRYHGHYVRLRCNIKTLAVEDQGSLYIQLDGIGNDELQETSFRGTSDWSEQEVILFVPEQRGGMIRFGIVLYGKGQVWLDNVRFESVESNIAM